jgi:hypothetical protein
MLVRHCTAKVDDVVEAESMSKLEIDVQKRVPAGWASNLCVLAGTTRSTRAEMLESRVGIHSASSTRVDSADVRHLDGR